MKKLLTIIALLFLLTMEGHAQSDEDRIFELINYRRDVDLLLDVSRYSDTYMRVQELTYDFSLNDECDCDGESIAGASTFDGLMLKLSDDYSYSWIHFNPDARWTSIAVVESNGIWYGVVRVWGQ